MRQLLEGDVSSRKGFLRTGNGILCMHAEINESRDRKIDDVRKGRLLPKKVLKLAVGNGIQRKESKWKKLDKGKDNASFIK